MAKEFIEDFKKRQRLGTGLTPTGTYRYAKPSQKTDVTIVAKEFLEDFKKRQRLGTGLTPTGTYRYAKPSQKTDVTIVTKEFLEDFKKRQRLGTGLTASWTQFLGVKNKLGHTSYHWGVLAGGP